LRREHPVLDWRRLRGARGLKGHAWKSDPATCTDAPRELALRIALGANTADLLGLVMSRSVVLTGVGIVVGLVVAVKVTRLLGYLLYNVSPSDPLAFGFAFAVVILAALAASVVPAWPASRTDPLLALCE
jgi:putative ABC transport system permease protein